MDTPISESTKHHMQWSEAGESAGKVLASILVVTMHHYPPCSLDLTLVGFSVPLSKGELERIPFSNIKGVLECLTAIPKTISKLVFSNDLFKKYALSGAATSTGNQTFLIYILFFAIL